MMKDFINQVKTALSKMSEMEKDEWILSQAKLCVKKNQEGFWQTLSGEKKIIDMPMAEEINKFCNRADSGEITFEYDTRYYEFDDDGRYCDDWKHWYNDLFKAVPFLNKIFAGCHNLMKLEDYQAVADILERVFNLKFPVTISEDADVELENDDISVSDLDEEGMFSMSLGDVGADWIKAVCHLTEGQDEKGRAAKLVKMLVHPACRKVKPRILLEEGISKETFSIMVEILEGEIACLELHRNKPSYWRAKRDIMRKKEVLSDLRVKCLKIHLSGEQLEEAKLPDCWKQIQEILEWLDYEKGSPASPEIDEVRKICKTLIEQGRPEQESWEFRKKVLQDIVKDEYYKRYNCKDAMSGLADWLCTKPEEYLAYAEMMEKSGVYGEKAAHLYHQYGRDDKYTAYLENHLNRGAKEYSALMAYYLEHNQKDQARRVAEKGLQNCREDLTEIFIFLLQDAKANGRQEQFKKLYASAKRRKYVDTKKVDEALNNAYTIQGW